MLRRFSFVLVAVLALALALPSMAPAAGFPERDITMVVPWAAGGRKPWDPADWTVDQRAMVDHPEQSPLFGLACQRLAGKPYTVSETNHPFPNDWASEGIPILAAYAGFQDWDAIVMYTFEPKLARSYRTGSSVDADWP